MGTILELVEKGEAYANLFKSAQKNQKGCRRAVVPFKVRTVFEKEEWSVKLKAAEAR